MSTNGPLASPREALERDLSALASFRAVEARGGRIGRLLADLDEQLQRLDAAVVVCVVGSTGAGKSALINALAGKPIAREGLDRPTTAEPVMYRPRDVERGVLPDVPCREEVYDPGRAGPWSGQVFLDAPDVNSFVREHRETVHRLVERSDVLLVVMHRQSVLEEAPLAFVDEYQGRRELVLVLGRVDELAPATLDALKEQVERLKRERWNRPDLPLFAVSAKEAQADPNQGHEFPQLVEHLRRYGDATIATRLRRSSAMGVLRDLSAVGTEIGRELGEDLARMPDDLRKALAAARARIEEDLATRLGVRSADVERHLYDEVGKHWHGPGGFFVRVGALSGAGLGLAALVARRNLVLGGAAALGSVVLDKGGRRLREHRLEAAAEVLPAREDVQRWYAAELLPLRARARRIGLGDDAVRSSPVLEEARAAWDEEALAEEAEHRLETAWTRSLARDLPQQALRTMPRALRLVLDVPTYALGLWIAWKVVSGFVTERYVGLDFLISSVLVVLIWAFVVRGVARFVIRRGTRTGLAALRTDFVRALSEHEQETVSRLEASLEPARDALRRLEQVAESWSRDGA